MRPLPRFLPQPRTDRARSPRGRRLRLTACRRRSPADQFLAGLRNCARLCTKRPQLLGVPTRRDRFLSVVDCLADGGPASVDYGQRRQRLAGDLAMESDRTLFTSLGKLVVARYGVAGWCLGHGGCPGRRRRHPRQAEPGTLPGAPFDSCPVHELIAASIPLNDVVPRRRPTAQNHCFGITSH